MHSTFFRFCLIILCVQFSLISSAQTFISDMEQMEWEKVAPGVWKTTIGEMDLNPLDYSASPKTQSLTNLGDPDFPFNTEATLSQKTKERVVVRLPLEEKEKIYAWDSNLNLSTGGAMCIP